MAIIRKTILTVKEALESSLCVPDYQRPYKWLSSHVNQLLDDIILHREKSRYRFGTLVLYAPDAKGEREEIVDGQQRLLTLSLLCAVLDKSQQHCSPSLLNQIFNNPITLRNIEQNLKLIRQRIGQLPTDDLVQIYHYLLYECELVCVTLDSLNEAFQFFDSQNARGKPLATYDLLKAFHLREMNAENEETRFRCVKEWERGICPESTTRPRLDTIISKTLFPIRRWTQGKRGNSFTRSHLSEFKGISINQSAWPYTQSLRLLNKLVDEFNNETSRQQDGELMKFPFQIDQPLLNGKRFFEYISYYTLIYKELFYYQHSPVKSLLHIIASYPGTKRTGDGYIHNLFRCTLLYFYDRFGDSHIEKAAEIIFAWCYQLRLEYYSVREETIERAAQNRDGLLHRIKLAVHPDEVIKYVIPVININQIKGKKIDPLVEALSNKGYVRHDN